MPSFIHLYQKPSFKMQFVLLNTMSRLRMKKNESFIIAKNIYFSTRMNLGRKKIVAMGSYDGAEICEFIGIYLLSQLCTIINRNNCGLYRDDGLMIQKHINGQQIDQLRKKIIKIFKEIDF